MQKAKKITHGFSVGKKFLIQKYTYNNTSSNRTKHIFNDKILLCTYLSNTVAKRQADDFNYTMRINIFIQRNKKPT